MNIIELYQTKRSSFIELNNRDWEILSFLEQQGYAAFQQINERFFSNKSTCSRRLNKLIEKEYIESKSVMEIAVRSSQSSALPFLMDLKLNQRSKVYFLSKVFRRKYAFSDGLIKNNMLMHQLQLNDLRLKIDALIPHKYLLSDPKIKLVSKVEGWRHETIRPDLSFEFNNFKLAIELERTRKSKSRYYERFSYLHNSVYSHVIYYTSDKRNLEFLIEQVRPYSKIAVGSTFNPEELYHNIYGQIDLQSFLRK